MYLNFLNSVEKVSSWQNFEQCCYCSDLCNACNCSDFRNESNGIFVLGWFFFLQTNFDFLVSHLISFERYCCSELRFEKMFHWWSFFVKL